VGIISGLGVIALSVHLVSEDVSIFVNGAGLLIVLGGTLSAALVTFSFRELKTLGRIGRSALRRPFDDTAELIVEIIQFVNETKSNRTAIQQNMDRVNNLFLREGLQLIVDRVSSDKIVSILVERMLVIKDEHAMSVRMLRTLGKYPPAFGMMGTVIGLVAVLQGLGGALGAGNLGPAMAVGLITTLYGLLASNLFFVPMADNLMLKSAIDLKKRKIVSQAVVMISQGEKAAAIQDSLNSMTKPSQRRDVLGLGGAELPQDGQKAT
jgi:chemotaxis protein MotA